MSRRAPVLARLTEHGPMDTMQLRRALGWDLRALRKVLLRMADDGTLERRSRHNPGTKQPVVWQLPGEARAPYSAGAESLEQLRARQRLEAAERAARRNPPSPAGAVETVEEFLARRGRIEQLPGPKAQPFVTVPAFPGRG